jgi:hypothetical protein
VTELTTEFSQFFALTGFRGAAVHLFAPAEAELDSKFRIHFTGFGHCDALVLVKPGIVYP